MGNLQPRAGGQRNQSDEPSVLLVDDQVDFREAIGLWLERRGFSVTTAENGAEAIASASQHQPDVILMDLNMPVLDGISATAQLKASSRLASIPVIGFTARPLTEVEAPAKAAGMHTVVGKQSLDDLIVLLRAVVPKH
jgi:CheY-like chemotaxis protein